MKKFNVCIMLFAILIGTSPVCAAGEGVKQEVGNVEQQAKLPDEKNTPFSSIEGFFDEFDKLFQQTFDWVDSSTEKLDDFCTKNIEETLKDIGVVAREMHKKAVTGVQSLKDVSVEVTSDFLKTAYSELKKGVQVVDGLVSKMQNEINLAKEFSQYTVKEHEDSERSVFGVKIMLPGFSKKDIKVNITQDKIRGAERKFLEVEAGKKQTIIKEKKYDKEGKKGVASGRFEQRMSSSSWVNGRKREISFDNGLLKVLVVLPSNVDDENYKMVFEDKMLTIEFPCKIKQAVNQKKSLKFSDDGPFKIVEIQ